MITDLQQDQIRSIFKHVEKKLIDSFQNYAGVNEPRFCCAFRYYSENKNCVAVWLDFPKLNAWQLETLFKRHKEIPHEFFIRSGDGFYRVGFKSKT